MLSPRPLFCSFPDQLFIVILFRCSQSNDVFISDISLYFGLEQLSLYLLSLYVILLHPYSTFIFAMIVAASVELGQ